MSEAVVCPVGTRSGVRISDVTPQWWTDVVLRLMNRNRDGFWMLASDARISRDSCFARVENPQLLVLNDLISPLSPRDELSKLSWAE